MNDGDELQRWEHLSAMARNWSKWAKHLEARGDRGEAAAVRRPAEQYVQEAQRLRGDSWTAAAAQRPRERSSTARTGYIVCARPHRGRRDP